MREFVVACSYTVIRFATMKLAAESEDAAEEQMLELLRQEIEKVEGSAAERTAELDEASVVMCVS